MAVAGNACDVSAGSFGLVHQPVPPQRGVRIGHFRAVHGGILLPAHSERPVSAKHHLGKQLRPPSRVERAAGGKIRLFDIRDFKYRAEHDFDVRYRTGVYDPEQLRSLDLYVSHWDGMDEIAHTLLRFNFSDGTALVLSVEMRCPEGISRDYYTTFFKQHALIYIWGTPEDLCDLRSKYRGEALYRYRTAATPDEVKMLFAALIDRTAELAEKQEFYRVISGNCTTELLPYLKAMRPALRWDHRVLINGSIDRMLFEQGFLVHGDGEIFEELRARSLVSKSATQP